MPCHHLVLPNGALAIVCGGVRQKACKCGAPSTLLCDWKVTSKTTCDAPVCAQHGLEVAPNKHLCPAHQVAYERWKAARTPTEPSKGIP